MHPQLLLLPLLPALLQRRLHPQLTAVAPAPAQLP
jgi:hypothetical protein